MSRGRWTLVALLALLVSACGTSDTSEGEGVGPDASGASGGEAGADAAMQDGAAATGGSTAAGGSGGGSSGAGGLGATCGSPNNCAAAVDLGSISGDNGGVVTHSEVGSRYLKLRVTEDSHGVLGEALEAKITLQVPPNADLDLYAYLDPDQDASPCGKLPFASADAAGTGQGEQLTLAWGDGLTGSGNNDSRTVVLEVAHKSGSCDTWTLTVQGDP